MEHRAVADVLEQVPVFIEGKHTVVDRTAQAHGGYPPHTPAVRLDVGVQRRAADFAACDIAFRRASRYAVGSSGTVVGGAPGEGTRVSFHDRV